MSDLCLTLLCPPPVTERLLDMLLMQEEIALFTSADSAVHGLHHAGLNDSELVLGLARMTQVEALLDSEHKAVVLATLRKNFAGTGLRYWLTPVIETGEFL